MMRFHMRIFTSAGRDWCKISCACIVSLVAVAEVLAWQNDSCLTTEAAPKIQISTITTRERATKRTRKIFRELIGH